MKCLICGSNTNYYFSKDYSNTPYKSFMKDIGVVDYYCCEHCGFTYSKTHQELDKNIWNKLNVDFHHYLEDTTIQHTINQPPYYEQAKMIGILGRYKLIDSNNLIDYAAGYGTLSNVLLNNSNIVLPIYDQYVKTNNKNYIKELKTVYHTVINSAMFEHILCREDLDDVNRLVSFCGCLILHTVVCENIPKDSSWFYLDPPVHTAFHTNRSMSILMKQWNYESSLYCPDSKCWVLFKRDIDIKKEKIEQINNAFQKEYLIYQRGFVDFWK